MHSDQCLIRVSDSLHPRINDISDSVFTVDECDPPIPGDVNGDCYVNIADIAIIAENWLRCGNPFDPRCRTIPEDMVLVPEGEYLMGSHREEPEDKELPVHLVKLDLFAMGKYEITNGQYCDYLNWAYSEGQLEISNGVVYSVDDSSNSFKYCNTSAISSESQIGYSEDMFSVRSKTGRDMSNDPMLLVSWYGAVAYCNWRSQQEGLEECYNLATWTCDFSKHGYRLPTEAEWEYAARGGHHDPYYRFPWGDTISHSQANYYSSQSQYDISPTRGHHPVWKANTVYPFTSPVGSFASNDYGLYDMIGNVWEWCNDWYSGHYYNISPDANPTGPTYGDQRVRRGSSWHYLAHVDSRMSEPPNYLDSNRNIGFRIVLYVE